MGPNEQNLTLRGWKFTQKHLFKEDKISKVKVIELTATLKGSNKYLQNVFWVRVRDDKNMTAGELEEQAKRREECVATFLPLAPEVERALCWGTSKRAARDIILST